MDNADYYKKKHNYIYTMLGYMYAELPIPNYDSALYFINIGYNYAVQANTLVSLGTACAAKARIFDMMRRYDSSEYYYK
jgi:hypothetical protein